MPQIGYAHRPVAMGRDGLVASAHPLATLTGIEMLKAGGTAADAAVATNAVLGVTQPYCCGVGGDIFCLYYEAATRRVHLLNGSGRSGARATLDETARREWSALPTLGAATVSVPGCVRGWAMLLERFGTQSLAVLLQPAIRYAARGFPTTSLVGQAIDEWTRTITDAEWHRIFAPGGRAPRAGELLVQEDLARTLEALAVEGPDLFYRGAVADAIARRLDADGFLTPEDLAGHTGEWGEPIRTTYRGATVYQTPPPTQGLAALLALNLVEGVPLARTRLGSADHLHILIEMAKLAYADRDRWIADPAHVAVPVERLLSKPYAERRRVAFDPRKAQAYTWGDPEGDTTGFVVADGRGDVVAVIQSLYNAWGSGVVPPGTGVLLHNRGRHFSLDPAHPTALAPGKRPFHTLSASIVTRDDRPLLALATMGGHGQAMFHLQILTNVLDHETDIQEAIERPRFVTGAFGPDDAPDTVHVEARVGRGVLGALARRGHRVKAAPDFFHRTGHAHGLILHDGTLTGGADPRGDGAALAY
jgi:gamma-glutamyltranspeptidase/glutathione hydrolase